MNYLERVANSCVLQKHEVFLEVLRICKLHGVVI